MNRPRRAVDLRIWAVPGAGRDRVGNDGEVLGVIRALATDPRLLALARLLCRATLARPLWGLPDKSHAKSPRYLATIRNMLRICQADRALIGSMLNPASEWTTNLWKQQRARPFLQFAVWRSRVASLKYY